MTSNGSIGVSKVDFQQTQWNCQKKNKNKKLKFPIIFQFIISWIITKVELISFLIIYFKLKVQHSHSKLISSLSSLYLFPQALSVYITLCVTLSAFSTFNSQGSLHNLVTSNCSALSRTDIKKDDGEKTKSLHKNALRCILQNFHQWP